MTISEMLGQSGILTLLGICVVFGFLIIMIFAMTLLHAVIHALKWDAPPPADTQAAAATSPQVDEGAAVAAIAAVLKEKGAL